MEPSPAGRALLATFPMVRVVNLASRNDRRREMAAELLKLGLAFGRDGVVRHEASRFPDAGHFPTVGTRGCFHSQLGVLEAALAADVPAVLLFEDDVDFTRDIEAKLGEALAALNARPWSIFYGGWDGSPRVGPIADGLRPIDPAEPIKSAHFVGFRRDAIERAVPYLRAMLERPVGSPEGGPMHVDGAYGWLRAAYPELTTWVADPQLGHQRPSRTDIHALGLHDRMPGVRGLMALARRVKRRLRAQG